MVGRWFGVDKNANDSNISREVVVGHRVSAPDVEAGSVRFCVKRVGEGGILYAEGLEYMSDDDQCAWLAFGGLI